MVHFWKRVVPIILVAAVLTAAIVSPAAAAPESPALTPTSSLRLGGERGLEASFAVSKDVTLALPWGDLKLTNVALQVATGGRWLHRAAARHGRHALPDLRCAG